MVICVDTGPCLLLMFGAQDSKLTGSSLSCGKDECVVFLGKTNFLDYQPLFRK